MVVSHPFGVYLMVKLITCKIASSSSERNTEPTSTVDGVPALLSHYQDLLYRIMNEPDVPGLSSLDLQVLRNEYYTSAHTCRLRSCPRATVGFESKRLRMEHEADHVRKRLHPCLVPGCQYPPLFSTQSLKAHMRQRHDAVTPRRSIRTYAPRTIPAAVRENYESTGRVKTRDQIDREIEELFFPEYVLPPVLRPLTPLTWDQDALTWADAGVMASREPDDEIGRLPEFEL